MNPALVSVARAAIPYALGAAVLGASILGVRWYGSNQYEAGYKAARSDMRDEAFAAADAAQQEKQNAEANYRGAVLAREAMSRELNRSNRLNGVLEKRIRATETSGPAGGVDGAGKAGYMVLAECVREYRAMGEDAGRLADKVNGWIGYEKALPRWGNAPLNNATR